MTSGHAHSCPALLIAAPASGQGKTTVTAALARLHARQGRRVRVFKCGPDFLDPHWLELASGAPVHSLDLWMTGPADCAVRLHAAAGESDLLLVEGVMGLFDGEPSAADLLARTPLGQMDARALQRWAVSFESPVPSHMPPMLLRGRTIAVARDAAFSFIYPANLELLQALGARLVFFSPLAGELLPSCNAVWLPGGYPELHAPRLASQSALRAALVDHVAQGRPLWAECGGMMALFEQLVTSDGASHRMWGLLPGTVTMQERLAALGPQQLALPGGVLRGHTFHFSRCDTPLAPVQRTFGPDEAGPGPRGEGLWRQGSLAASYFHAWFPSSPPAVAALFGGPAEKA
jgi:cobyrinic acid a,c-diamide synthase